ncbi:hypothetical protein [Candidatus Mycoplasma haematominutum]|nr:hypothetical protein [Candidatus Mycoplasma haematominutum]
MLHPNRQISFSESNWTSRYFPTDFFDLGEEFFERLDSLSFTFPSKHSFYLFLKEKFPGVSFTLREADVKSNLEAADINAAQKAQLITIDNTSENETQQKINSIAIREALAYFFSPKWEFGRELSKLRGVVQTSHRFEAFSVNSAEKVKVIFTRGYEDVNYHLSFTLAADLFKNCDWSRQMYRPQIKQEVPPPSSSAELEDKIVIIGSWVPPKNS